MKFTLPILALVASAYCVPITHPASALGGAVAPPASLTRAVTEQVAARKRSEEQQGEPTFFDAGNPNTNPVAVSSKDATTSTSTQPAASAPASLGQVGEEVGAALGTTLKPILAPVASLTNGLDITKRSSHAVPSTPPPAFGQPTKQNPNPNSAAPKGQTPKSGPTMSGDGTIHSGNSPLISASINLKDRDVEAEKRQVAAVVLKNGLVAGVTQDQTAGN